MEKGQSEKYLSKFGENLRKIREAKKISLRELAASCDIDYSDISKIERGERNVTLLTIIQLADALEIKPKKLLDFE